ncbi:MAG: BMP family ABC transporter substrate-binding protein [Candidatus Thorarchaeota archaeon]|nr:BMP family ABC transporter substrate-binding protein [Candidatus Thorarchaeota archaeon]
MSSRSGLIPAIVIVIIVFGAVGGLLFITNQYESSRVAVVTMNPGWGDMSRADQLRDGLELRSAAVLYEWIDPPETTSEANTLIDNLAASGRYILIIAVGQELTDAVDSAAVAYPNQKFALIGDTIETRNNVASVGFAMEQGAFLAGVTAATVAAGDPGHLIGVLGTVETDDAANVLIAGFRQGVMYANESLGLSSPVFLTENRWVGSFNDSETAYDMTYEYFTVTNVSIIFAPVRGSIVGVREAIIAANHTLIENYTFRDPYVIAAENNLDYYGLPNLSVSSGRTWITTSVIATFDEAAYNIINQTLWDRFTPGADILGLANGAVNITEFRWTSYVSVSTRELIFSVQDLIINGTIVITVP